MIKYSDAVDFGILVRECMTFMLLHGNNFKAVNLEKGLTTVDFTRSQFVVTYDGLKVLHIESLVNSRIRLSVPEHLNYTHFYSRYMISPTCGNNMGEVKKRMDDDLYCAVSEVIELVPEVPEDEWDSQLFQLSTIYEPKTAQMLLLEPFVTKPLAAYVPTVHLRLKLYTVSDGWCDLPFDRMSRDICEMHTGYRN